MNCWLYPALLGALTLSAQSDQDRRVESMLQRMTLAQKIDLLGGVDLMYLRAVPEIGLPALKMSDGPMGVRSDGPSTTAGGMALAASWNTTLAERLGVELGHDARSRGVHFLLGPGVNLTLAPMNGRNFEYFGEDPLLAGRIAASYIQGLQKQGVSAVLKHFLGNNSEFDRHGVEAIIDERALRELYLRTFEIAVKEGHTGALMDSYNLVNGAHLTQNGHFNNDVVKKEWKYEGLIMSDWFATYDGLAAANGGMDVEMPMGIFMNRASLLPAIEKGQVSVATIDDKVRRILKLAVRFGWLEREQMDLTVPRDNDAGKNVALDVAREGIVLLKNAGALPLDRARIKSIAVIGPDAHPAVPAGGGSGQGRPFQGVSFLEGIKALAGAGVKVYYHRGLPTISQLAMTTMLFQSEAGGGPGVKVETFDNKDLQGKPTSVRMDMNIFVKPPVLFSELVAGDAPMPDMTPKPPSSARWSGIYLARTAGTYTAFVNSPSDATGGYRLKIDDKVVIDGWDVRKAVLDQAAITLTAGPHKVVLERHAAGVNVMGDLVRAGVVHPPSVVDPAAKAIAAKADVVIIAAGFDPEIETEGGDRTFGLPPGQDELIREISAVNRNTVVVLTSGSAVDTKPWLDRVPALLQAWYPGQEGGTALAEILFGDVNPSGRLPVSFEKRWEDNPAHDSYYPGAGTSRVVYRAGLFVGYRGYEHNGVEPQFPFGHGLSYTTFRYSHLSVKPLAGDASFEVSFDVTNTGAREGSEVAQLYVGEGHPRLPRPPKELKGFAKVALKPGETKPIRISLDARSFAYFDPDAKAWRADAGEFNVNVGHSSATAELGTRIILKAAVSIPVQE